MTKLNIAECRRKYNDARRRIQALREIQVYSKHDRAFLESVASQPHLTERQEAIVDVIFEKYVAAIARKEGGL